MEPATWMLWSVVTVSMDGIARWSATVGRTGGGLVDYRLHPDAHDNQAPVRPLRLEAVLGRSKGSLVLFFLLSRQYLIYRQEGW